VPRHVCSNSLSKSVHRQLGRGCDALVSLVKWRKRWQRPVILAQIHPRLGQAQQLQVAVEYLVWQVSDRVALVQVEGSQVVQPAYCARQPCESAAIQAQKLKLCQVADEVWQLNEKTHAGELAQLHTLANHGRESPNGRHV